jgi:glutaredoxin
MMTTPRKAVLHRMVMPTHTCPYGIKAKWLLERRGYTVEDRWLTTRDETDAFKAEHGVATTPQAFIEGRRIGGYDDLRRHFGLKVRTKGEASYVPVVAVFAMAALISMAMSQAFLGTPWTRQAAEGAIALLMCLLAMLKLQDVETFSSMFLNYDLLAKRWVPYAYLYPFAEGAAGLLMLARVAPAISIPLALTIGTIGAVSVFKAVYVDKRELKCACVGGSSPVPLGFVSLSENLAMIGMAIWMLVHPM